MSALLPDGEELRKAVNWVSGEIQKKPDQPLQPLVQKAIFTYDLSPKDGEFLIGFFRKCREENQEAPPIKS